MLNETRLRLRSMSTVALGGALGTGITFCSSVVISHLFVPEDFGVFSTLIALVMTFSTIVSGRLEMAVPLPRSDREARKLLLIGAAIATTISLLALVGIVLATHELGIRFWLPDRVARALWTVPLLLVPIAGFQLLNAWALRDSRFGAIARRTVLQSLVTAGLQMLFGALHFGVFGLLLGYAVGQTVGCVSLYLGASLRGLPGDVLSIKQTLTRYWKFPLVLTPAGLLNSLGIQAPVLLIAGLFGAHAAGIFGLTQRVLAVPVVLISQATSSVYASELAKLRRTGQRGALSMFYTTSRHLAFVSAPMVPIVMLLSPWGFSLVFGDLWRESGELTRAMAIPLGILMISAPMSQTLIVYERSELQLMWDATRLISICATFVIMHDLGANLLQTVWTYSAISSVFYAISWFLARRTLRAASDNQMTSFEERGANED